MPFFSPVVGEAASFLFTDFGVSGANQATYTFSDRDLGTGASGKKIAVFATSRAVGGTNQTVDALTVGGNTATLIGRTGGGTVRIELWEVSVGALETGDVVVEWNASLLACGIEVLALYDAGAVFDFSGANDDNTTLDIPSGGVALAGIQSSDTSTFSWSGLTEQDDRVVEAGNLSMSCAGDAFAGAQTGHAISATPSSSSNPRIVAASWAKA